MLFHIVVLLWWFFYFVVPTCLVVVVVLNELVDVDCARGVEKVAAQISKYVVSNRC
jgi:hypothetical protein